MVVLAIALIRGWLPQQKVEGACKVLQKNIILFFLPAGVACIDYFDMIGSHFAEIAISSVLSTILVVSVAAIFYQTRRT